MFPSKQKYCKTVCGICSVCILNISDYIIILFALVFKDILPMLFFNTKFIFFTWERLCHIGLWQWCLEILLLYSAWGCGRTSLMCWESLSHTRTQNAVTRGVCLWVRSSLGLMKTGGEITAINEPQISFLSVATSWGNFYNLVVRFSFLIDVPQNFIGSVCLLS